MKLDPQRPNQALARQRFSRAAQTYDEAAFIQREIGTRLMERLDYIRLQPERLLDLGCGTGLLCEQALARYPKAQVVGLDIATNMMDYTLQRFASESRLAGVCADASALPLAENSMDMLLSNLMLQWCNDLPQVFRECARVLRPEGLLMFSTLGPDTLQELRKSWSQVDGYAHTSRFEDMHNVGDALVAAGFRDPVVDREVITLTYADVRGLLNDLKSIGANNATAGRARGLTGKQRWQAFYQAYDQFKQADGRYPATYEVIYGHAWAPKITPADKPERFISVHVQKF